ncbi:hypothetical protein DFH09DRAFT_1079649 [Mycena vulgaris]|nr:hypothetical protein DFH09DRAFT_1079649 [Mycena vulgaris]
MGWMFGIQQQTGFDSGRPDSPRRRWLFGLHNCRTERERRKWDRGQRKRSHSHLHSQSGRRRDQDGTGQASVHHIEARWGVMEYRGCPKREPIRPSSTGGAAHGSKGLGGLWEGECAREEAVEGEGEGEIYIALGSKMNAERARARSYDPFLSKRRERKRREGVGGGSGNGRFARGMRSARGEARDMGILRAGKGGGVGENTDRSGRTRWASGRGCAETQMGMSQAGRRGARTDASADRASRNRSRGRVPARQDSSNANEPRLRNR